MATLKGGKNKDTLNGGVGNDLMDGGDNADYLSGGDGNDAMYGGADDDFLNGGAGNDVLDGGGSAGLAKVSSIYTSTTKDGNDIVDGDAGNDTLIYTLARNYGQTDNYIGGSGWDKLQISLNAQESAPGSAALAAIQLSAPWATTCG